MDNCPDCANVLPAEATTCVRCGWAAFKPSTPAKTGPRCGNCGTPLTGPWTQSPKGRVGDPCWHGYMDGFWPPKAAA